MVAMIYSSWFPREVSNNTFGKIVFWISFVKLYTVLDSFVLRDSRKGNGKALDIHVYKKAKYNCFAPFSDVYSF